MRAGTGAGAASVVVVSGVMSLNSLPQLYNFLMALPMLSSPFISEFTLMR